MKILQIDGEDTLVVKTDEGFYKIATGPELYPFVAKTLGLEGKTFDKVGRQEVENSFVGYLQAGLTFVRATN